MFRYRRMGAWLPLAWCAACAAAPEKPRQLCETELTPQQSIASNYRYARDPAQRTVEGLERWSCEASRATLSNGIPLCDDFVEALACGVGDHVETNQCLDLSDWWTDHGDGRLSHLTDREGAPAPQFKGTVEELVYGHGQQRRCYTMAYLVGFFNGVWNTREEAERSLEVLRQQDLAEVFRQRSAEMGGLLARRWEYFWEQVTGQHAQAGSFTRRLLARAVRSDQALASWVDALGNAMLAKVTALGTVLAGNPPTAQDAAAHAAQLIRAGQRAERAVLVANSQGNLFANAAYDAYLAHSRQAGRAAGEDTGYVAAQVVHIAPASPTLRRIALHALLPGGSHWR